MTSTIDKEYFDILCNGFKTKYPNGDTPNIFYLDFIHYVFMDGAASGGMDSSVFQDALDYFSEDQNVKTS